MPPRGAPRGRGGPPGAGGGGAPTGDFRGRGAPRGIGRGKGRGGPGGGAHTAASPDPGPVFVSEAPVHAAAHVTTVGAPRMSFGKSGQAVTVLTNVFPCTAPSATISHYDIVIQPAEKILPVAFNMRIIKKMQESYPDVFNPKGAYDGRKNMFVAKEFDWGSDPYDPKTFNVILDEETTPAGKPPKVYKVILKKVAEINPTTLNNFLAGNSSLDSDVLTAITALNVVIRMEPNLRYPFNVRSFFTPKEIKSLGAGIDLWRGYFQSVRPSPKQLVINIDISTGAMHKPGDLITVALEVLSDQFKRDAKLQELQPKGENRGGSMDERIRVIINRYLHGVRVITNHRGNDPNQTPKTIRRVANQSAAGTRFKLKEGGEQTIEEYFRRTYNIKLKHPNLACIEVGAGALIPMEVCTIVPGQILRKQIPPNKIRDVLSFSTQKPGERHKAIKRGLEVMAYGTSEYLRSFGMKVGEAPLAVPARVLPPPRLMYGQQLTVAPRDGAWNMKGKRFFRPAVVSGKWWVWNLAPRVQSIDIIVEMLIQTARETGIEGWTANLVAIKGDTHNRAPGSSLLDYYESLWQECVRRAKGDPTPPFLIVVVLPPGSAEMYSAVKYFGDILKKQPTQCLAGSKAESSHGKEQYYANVMLKANVKLGGINVIPEQQSVPYLMNKAEPAIVFGADVIHPTPGGENRPSFGALVSSVDTNNSKYIASLGAQTSRQEIISDLNKFAQASFHMFKQYRKHVEGQNTPPTRIFYFRDGVSEGQFAQILDTEIPALKSAAAFHGLIGDRTPKVTAIVVGKRHHVRMFPKSDGEGDRSGNCRAGTVIDQGLGHPTEFDFFLQSHGGLLGTSKSSHYSVLLDENKMKPDDLQQLCFSLCHVYARSTRSVSIPAPVYYADIVCARYKNHFAPDKILELETSLKSPQSGGGTSSDKIVSGDLLGEWKSQFGATDGATARNMYFM